MTKREAAIVSAYTGVMLGTMGDMCEYIEEILKRPVFTHELANQKVVEEIRKASKPDFMLIKVK